MIFPVDKSTGIDKRLSHQFQSGEVTFCIKIFFTLKYYISAYPEIQCYCLKEQKGNALRCRCLRGQEGNETPISQCSTKAPRQSCLGTLQQPEQHLFLLHHRLKDGTALLLLQDGDEDENWCCRGGPS